jgi:hypothetical protein
VRQVAAEGVCLFCGGLGSLCGVIHLLEENPDQRLCLLSNYEGGQASRAQTRLFRQLRAHYGQRVVSLRLFLRPAPTQLLQARALPPGRETTTRPLCRLPPTACSPLHPCFTPRPVRLVRLETSPGAAHGPHSCDLL